MLSEIENKVMVFEGSKVMYKVKVLSYHSSKCVYVFPLRHIFSPIYHDDKPDSSMTCYTKKERKRSKRSEMEDQLKEWNVTSPQELP